MLVAGVGTVRVPVADEAHVDAVAIVAAELTLRTLQGAVQFITGSFRWRCFGGGWLRRFNRLAGTLGNVGRFLIWQHVAGQGVLL